MYSWETGLADVLRSAGCTVIEEPGWKTRGRPGGTFEARAIILHHDASPAGSTSSGADVIINGRPGLEGPLAQLWLDFDGRWHVCAAGRANHAGEGSWPGIPTNDGNAYTLGIETDHTTNEAWSDPQREGGARGLLALTEHLGVRRDAEALYRGLFAHKEWAPTRKVDPDPLDMDALRTFLLDFTPGAPVRTLQKGGSFARDLTSEQWTDLQFGEQDDKSGTYAILRGPVAWYAITVQAYVSGPAGTGFQLRPLRTFDGHDQEYLFAVRDYVIPDDGTIGIEVTHQGALADDWWYRVQGRSLGADLVVTKTWAEVACW